MLAALELREEVVLRVEVAGRAPAAVAGPQLARTKRPRPCSAARAVEPAPVKALLELGLQCGQWRLVALAVLVDPEERRLQIVALALLATQLLTRSPRALRCLLAFPDSTDAIRRLFFFYVFLHFSFYRKNST